jgi:hypothetical protein
VTPRAVKKAASTSWRVANPQTGVRQEIEGRAIKKARRGLFRRSHDSTGRTIPDSTDSVRDSVEELKRLGCTPDKVTPQLVPVLRDCGQFHAIDLERQDAIRSLEAASRDESALAAVFFVTWAYTAQMDLIRQLLGAPHPPDGSYLRFLAWSEAWRDSATVEMEHRCVQQDELIGRVDARTVEVVGGRVEKRINALLKRTAPQRSR